MFIKLLINESLSRHMLPVPENSFPLCVDVLISVFDALDLNKTQRDYWNDTLKEYRDNGDCMKLLTTIARQLNFWVRKGTTKSVHTCPPEKLHMIMALDGKNGQIPITRAVWLIYSELQTEGLPSEFTQNILPVMEEWMAQQQATVTRQQSLDTVQSLLCKLLTVQ